MQEYTSIPAHAETQKHLYEIGPPIFALSIGRPERSGSLGGVRLRPRERKGRGVLMEPGRRDGIHRQGVQGDRALHLVEIGRKQRLQDMA